MTPISEPEPDFPRRIYLLVVLTAVLLMAALYAFTAAYHVPRGGQG